MNNTLIIGRFFAAIHHYMESNNIRFFSNFCEAYDMPRTSLLRLEKEPHRQFHPAWLAKMVSLGYSAHWLLTGKGDMMDNTHKKTTQKTKKKIPQKKDFL